MLIQHHSIYTTQVPILKFQHSISTTQFQILSFQYSDSTTQFPLLSFHYSVLLLSSTTQFHYSFSTTHFPLLSSTTQFPLLSSTTPFHYSVPILSSTTQWLLCYHNLFITTGQSKLFFHYLVICLRNWLISFVPLRLNCIWINCVFLITF